MQELERKLKPNCLHVGLLQGGGDVHVHVQEPLHGASLLCLLDLKLGEETDEPLEGSLLSVDPEEVHFPQVHHLRFEIIGPAIGALGTRVPGSPVSRHHLLVQKCQPTTVVVAGIQVVRGLNGGVFYIVVWDHRTTGPGSKHWLWSSLVLPCKSSVGSAALTGW